MYEEDERMSLSIDRRGLPYADHVTVSAHAIAVALRERLPNLSAVKLQKLLYYCQEAELGDREDAQFNPYPAEVAEIVAGAVERAKQREGQTATPDSLEEVLAWAHRVA